MILRSPLAPALLVALFLGSAFSPTTVARADLVHSSYGTQYWCLARLLEKEPLCGAACDFEPLRDLDDPEAIRSRLPALIVKEGASPGERYAAFRGFPIEDVTAAPGHVYLRNPAQLKKLTEYIRTSGGGEFGHDPLLFNIVTDSSGKVVTIDLWNAHHRLVAYLEAGYHFLDEIPERNFKILLNGKTAEGETWRHYLPVAGLDETAKIETWEVPVGHEIRPGTVSVEGKHENFKLGSRNTVGKLRRNMLFRKQPKIGIYFGSFDPPHAGHLAVIEQAIEAMGLDEVVVVPNAKVTRKPNLTPLEKRLPMMREFVKGHPRVNLYVGDSGLIIGRYGRDPFVERMAQTYGTHDLYQIIGEDSYALGLTNGDYQPAMNRKLLVVPRPGQRVDGGLVVPENLQERVKVLPEHDVQDLSSTMIRRLISEGKPTDESVLAPGVRRVADELGLYRTH